MKNIILIGFMGSGKSSVSNHLSYLLKLNEIDTDKYIETQEKMSIHEIFSQKGENYFRDLETKLLTDLQNKNSLIISCGGGMPLREENQKLLKTLGTVFLLTASPETTFNRVKTNNNRPLLNDNMNLEYITKMIESRKDKYLKTSDFVIDTDNKTISEICNEIKNLVD